MDSGIKQKGSVHKFDLWNKWSGGMKKKSSVYLVCCLKKSWKIRNFFFFLICFLVDVDDGKTRRIFMLKNNPPEILSGDFFHAVYLEWLSLGA